MQVPALSLDPAVRATAAIGLMAVGIIHALEIQGQISGALWLTAAFWGLAAVAPLAGLWLLARPSPLAWQFSGSTCLLAFIGYILTRSVPIPGDRGDVGNWLEPLGVTALMTEGIVTALAALVLLSIFRRSPGGMRLRLSAGIRSRPETRRTHRCPAFPVHTDRRVPRQG